MPKRFPGVFFDVWVNDMDAEEPCQDRTGLWCDPETGETYVYVPTIYDGTERINIALLSDFSSDEGSPWIKFKVTTETSCILNDSFSIMLPFWKGVRDNANAVYFGGSSLNQFMAFIEHNVPFTTYGWHGGEEIANSEFYFYKNESGAIVVDYEINGVYGHSLLPEARLELDSHNCLLLTVIVPENNREDDACDEDGNATAKLYFPYWKGVTA